MSLKVDTVESCWASAKQPLYDFFFRTHHPDLDVSDQRQSFIPPMAMQASSAHPAGFAMQ
jgi:hypothetical protein